MSTPEPSLISVPPVRQSPVRIITDDSGMRLFRDDMALTPPFAAIESFDVSFERREVVFSARRTSNFDIGLVSLDGSHVNWVPEDSGDEVGPRWAPRGHKISFVVRNIAGDFVRSVHVPTAVALTVDFPAGVVRDVRWEPAAEEFEVTWETVDASPRVERMTYAGERRRIITPPATRLDVAVEPFSTGALLIRPKSVRYDEKLPVVVWIEDGRRNTWDPERAKLIQSKRAVHIVTATGDQPLWNAIRERSMLDVSRVYVVDPTGNRQPSTGNYVLITADPTLPKDHYRQDGKAVRVHPSGVKSFAAGFIADQLK